VTSPVLTLLLAGSATLCMLMLLLWAVHFPIRNAAIVDAGWAGGLALLAGIYAWGGNGFLPRRLLMGGMGAIWGVRLAGYLLFSRVLGHPEEGRYVQLRREWGGNIGLKFLLFFQFQALLCLLLSPPFLLPALNRSPVWSPLEFAGTALWLVAMAGEVLADMQLKAFKSTQANRGKTCRVGLWRYSRHPNYFFEWLIWVAYALFALASPYGFVALFSPALMLYFLLKVTGIPATEAQALRTRGEDYRRYQESTSVFVPWFPTERT
jgi:steroid 5-alpha reductase family enzyme